MSRNDRKSKDDADVEDERGDEQLRFVRGRQDSDRIQKTVGRRQESNFPFVIGRFKFEVQQSNPEGCQKVAGGRSETKTTG